MSKKGKVLPEVVEFETSPDRIRQIMESAGSRIAAVHFRKRKNGELRKMSYRLHVQKPSVASVPDGNSNRRQIDLDNNQMTVLDVNKVVKDENGEVIGRGAWRTVPLEAVVQISVHGKRYKIAGRS